MLQFLFTRKLHPACYPLRFDSASDDSHPALAVEHAAQVGFQFTPSRASESESMNRKLYVGNLPYQTTDADLAELFGSSGDVASVTIMRDGHGRARGFASSRWPRMKSHKIPSTLNGCFPTAAASRGHERARRTAHGGFCGGGGGGRGQGVDARPLWYRLPTSFLSRPPLVSGAFFFPPHCPFSHHITSHPLPTVPARRAAATSNLRCGRSDRVLPPRQAPSTSARRSAAQRSPSGGAIAACPTIRRHLVGRRRAAWS